MLHHLKFNKRLKQLLLASLALVTLFVAGLSTTASALSGSEFDPGRIIDDAVFYNADSMTSAQIQQFLEAKVSVCDTNGEQPYAGTTRAQYGADRGYPPPYTCLKDYRQDITARNPEDSLCNGMAAASNIRASEIIYRVAQSCGVSPKVLLVLLQKEQSLVTDDWPWSIQYRSATGYGCPDTAPCDEEYYGFYNQVYMAARVYKYYATYPHQFNHIAGRNNYVSYNPNSNCGGSNIFIQNQATAGLYNYTPYQPNAAALNNLYGTGDGCSAYGNRNFWRMFNDWFGSTRANSSILSFKSHVKNDGWMPLTHYTGMTGTTGENKPMEAFKINGEVEYSSYDHTTGWQPTINHGMISGTTGQSKPIQALKINPIGSLAEKYDLYYRVHMSNVGWMGWTKNGAPAGVTGDSGKNIEAFQIALTAKGAAAPGSTSNPYQNINTVSYTPPVSLSIASHVGDVGWQPHVVDNMVTGTTEQAKRIEAIRIKLNNSTPAIGTVKYSAHVADSGWQNWKDSDEISGTTGNAKQMEAIRITLTQELDAEYDIWYRSHVARRGWSGWAKNGSPSGSVGAGLQLEAVEVRLAPKNSLLFPQSNNLYNPQLQPIPDTYSINFSTHVSDIGWINDARQNYVGGTTGKAKSMEAMRINSSSSIFGQVVITCSAYVRNEGWTANVAPLDTCGTTGQAKPLESVKLTLSGDASKKYDIYYRAHVARVGWQGWVKGGEVAGTPDSGNPIEAIIVKLVEK